MLLADMGAEVIKVEPPDGDSMRQWPPISDGFSENFASLNRNKRSVTFNLKSGDDRQHARRLIQSAQVVVENNRPGVMDRLGLGYRTFSDAMPELVYCSISAFGQTGPRAEQGGFDLTIQAMSGIMSVTGEPEGIPVKAGVPISDFASGLYAAYAIAAKLLEVSSGRKGGYIDISMLSASLAVGALQTSEYFGTGRNPVKLGSAHPRNAPYQAYQAADGYFVVAAGNNKLWRSFCAAINRLDLTADARFQTTSDRALNQIALAELLRPVFIAFKLEDLLGRLAAAGVPSGPINSYSEALADPQVAHLELVQSMELPGGASTSTFGSPIRIDGASLPVRQRPPALGEHTQDVLSELRKTELSDVPTL
jgi:crotonobetainyl-CoA:carnitine CoA-transferase CaiB-like acyl-CoA transferase